MTTELSSPPRLAGGLRQRHLTMIAMGGVIGSGLFVGSSAGIALAGPGIVFSFLLAGLLAVLVMRMMAEMAAALPSSGSFSEHAERAYGPWAGFTIGWLYWVGLMVAVAMEATVAAMIVNGWFPMIPQWALVLIFMTAFTVVNLAAVGNFGEFEFWFAWLKVAAIIVFLALGLLAFFGVLPGTNFVGTANLTELLPNGWSGVITGLLAIVFAFGGLEVVTIAAAESDNPAHAVGRAVRTAVWRIFAFYIGSMLIVVTLVPWNQIIVGESPFAAVLTHIGIPAASQIMNAVVVVALLSALNANIYASARMIYSLAERGKAPRAVTRLDRNQVPYVAVLASVAFGFVAVVLNIVWPDTLFYFMLNAVGAVLLLVWIMVACSQLRLRRVLESTQPASLTVKMWAYPYLTWAALIAMIGILLLMLTDSAGRVQLMSSGILVAVVLAISLWHSRTHV
ncbi:amino acid permease [Kibdelosporangium philippinense]|uniref:Amino acid permease n=1 Tax=Kibdelosporangium philippinense TaxID=211113 RepID=A0ABS8ZQH5_9PSEU|nr:amino acid permease [Kibdelosporangium philippinense]MCE7008876.1 amino acid permease [Kibdelosporangium philippinense]